MLADRALGRLALGLSGGEVSGYRKACERTMMARAYAGCQSRPCEALQVRGVEVAGDGELC